MSLLKHAVTYELAVYIPIVSIVVLAAAVLLIVSFFAQRRLRTARCTLAQLEDD
jgi:hypothetical protein